MNFIRKQTEVVLTAALWLSAALVANATIITTKDSSDFDWKYEMDVLPNADDQDGDLAGDWQAASGVSVAGGILTQPSGNVVGALAYVGSNLIWDNSFNQNDGWTIEARIKVLSQLPLTAAATNILGHFAGATHEGRLNIGATGQRMGNNFVFETIGSGTEDNTDDFHVFRMALSPGGENKYSVWRDGALLLDEAPSVAAPGPGENATWVYFGDLGSAWGGEVQYDYFRLTSGAFAPVPEPSSIALVGSLLLLTAMLRRRTWCG